MKKTTERTINDITNIAPFRSLAHEPEHCGHADHSIQQQSTTAVWPGQPEIQALIYNYLQTPELQALIKNYLQNASNASLTTTEIQALIYNSLQTPELQALIDNYLQNASNAPLTTYAPNNDILRPIPQYPSCNYGEPPQPEEDRIQKWLSKVKQPSRESAIRFANMNHFELHGKTNKEEDIFSSSYRLKKKHNK